MSPYREVDGHAVGVGEQGCQVGREHAGGPLGEALAEKGHGRVPTVHGDGEDFRKGLLMVDFQRSKTNAFKNRWVHILTGGISPCNGLKNHPPPTLRRKEFFYSFPLRGNKFGIFDKFVLRKVLERNKKRKIAFAIFFCLLPCHLEFYPCPRAIFRGNSLFEALEKSWCPCVKNIR